EQARAHSEAPKADEDEPRHEPSVPVGRRVVVPQLSTPHTKRSWPHGDSPSRAIGVPRLEPREILAVSPSAGDFTTFVLGSAFPRLGIGAGRLCGLVGESTLPARIGRMTAAIEVPERFNAAPHFPDGPRAQ